MISLWWLALPLLLLPIWWHRQKRERPASMPLATARFLPRSNPLHRRVWRWHDRLLLLLRCLLLLTVIAWLADLIVPWRGDAVLVAPGTEPAWAERQIKDAGYAGASRVDVPQADVFGWLARHEREWKRDARLLLIGPVAMPAAPPRLAHAVEVRSAPAVEAKTQRRVAIVSKRAGQWRAMFAALDAPQRYLVQLDTTDGADLIIWDVPEAPPAKLRASLWWVGDATAFPELKTARTFERLRYTDSARGRLWSSDAWPAPDADTARAQFETWQALHYAPVSWLAPSRMMPAAPSGAAFQASGALRYLLTIALLILFALERIVTHAKRR